MREIIFWIIIILLFGTAMGEFGFIMGSMRGQSFNHEGKLLQHNTRIMILESEVKMIKEDLKNTKGEDLKNTKRGIVK